jgi:formylglycine-generating enzyme required for sulfatase activity
MLYALVGGNISEGNSGGPVLKDDVVVGMVTRVERGSGRAVPAQLLRLVLEGWRIDVATSARATAPRQPRVQASQTKPALSPGQTFKDCEDCPEMVVVPPGRFTMGSDKQATEQPLHEVVIIYPFAVGNYEVTHRQFAQFVRESGYDMGDSCWQDPGSTLSDQHPVVCVSWNDAKAYAKWLTAKTGKPYRLLSEAEWEYAARAGTTTLRFWGDDERSACRYANVQWCGAKSTAQTGQFKPNAFGLYDMLGNVVEWVEDCWNASYDGAPVDGSPWVTGDCISRVGRGGAWVVEPHYTRSAYRGWIISNLRDVDLGFRVARKVP